MSHIHDLPVQVAVRQGREEAWLNYEDGRPNLKLQSGEKISFKHLDEIEIRASITVTRSGSQKQKELDKFVKIRLAPLIIAEKEYIPDGSRPEPLYPPSTNGWLSRLIGRGTPCFFFIHEILNDDKKWLSIVDADSFVIYESHPVLQYETGVLELIDEIEARRKMLNIITYPHQVEADRIIKDVLDCPPPSWSELASITRDVYIPGLQIGDTMRSTMDQLVPKQMMPEIRVQVMAFLAMLIKNSIPDEDPVDYLWKLVPAPFLVSLVNTHLQCILRNYEIPSYVRIFQESATRRLTEPSKTKTASRALEDAIWHDAYYKIFDSIPINWDTSIRYTTQLNNSGRIIAQLPVTRKAAAASRKRWTERFELWQQSLLIKTDVRPSSIGLTRLVYIGSAHQWPHKHLKWATRLGGQGPHEPHVHVMEMPLKSAEQVTRIRPNVMRIEWSANVFNSQLYNSRVGGWKNTTSRLLNSVEGSRTIRRLGNEFGRWKSGKVHKIIPVEARILDMSANNCELASMEHKEFLDYWKVAEADLVKILEELKAKGVITTAYRPNLWNLTTIVVLAQGESERVCSLARGLLKYTPTAMTMISMGGKWLLSLIRVPPSAAHEVVAALPEKAAEHGVTVRCDRASSFRSYVQDFYSRLLLEDGTWEDDVSAMLSQIRVPYREPTPEEN